MAFPVRCCALVGKFEDPRIAESVNALVPHLTRRGVKVLVSEHDPPGVPGAGVTQVADGELGARADLLIAIGGDGTLLHAARLVESHAVPVVGVNIWRLGLLYAVIHA